MEKSEIMRYWLQEIYDIAVISSGADAAFYAMLAKRGLDYCEPMLTIIQEKKNG